MTFEKFQAMPLKQQLGNAGMELMRAARKASNGNVDDAAVYLYRFIRTICICAEGEAEISACRRREFLNAAIYATECLESQDADKIADFWRFWNKSYMSF